MVEVHWKPNSFEFEGNFCRIPKVYLRKKVITLMKTQKKYAMCAKNIHWFSHCLTVADIKCYLRDIDDVQIKHSKYSVIAFSQRYKKLFKYPLLHHHLDIVRAIRILSTFPGVTSYK